MDDMAWTWTDHFCADFLRTPHERFGSIPGCQIARVACAPRTQPSRVTQEDLLTDHLCA